MDERKKPVVGQILYSLNVGNAARRTEQKLTPVKVVKVGRKYFSCQQEGRRFTTEYHLDSWCEKTEYLASSHLYENPEEWENQREATQICKEIYAAFEYRHNKKNLSLATLRAIKKLIDKQPQLS